MKDIINKILPDNDMKRKWVSVGITIAISGLLTLWGIYGIGQYGLALFIFTPLFIGAGSSILFGLKKQISKQDAFQISLLTLGVFTASLIIFAMEGLICIAMAAPIALLLTWVGSRIGYMIINKSPDKGPPTILILICLIPITAFFDREEQPTLSSVVTSIEIDADPATVWKNVVEFPQLAEPTEFIFKAGIAYPTDAKIEGTGVGSIRYCNFTTGTFVEPVTIWDEPRLLKFDVAEQPEPMKEIGLWDIKAPHLQDYFVSKEGQFKLIPLPNGKTILEGTTWYYHKIRPEFYWRIWSNHIIHKIHQRVLKHIKYNAEASFQKNTYQENSN